MDGIPVFLRQQHAKEFAHLLHPDLPHWGAHTRVLQHLLQRADVVAGPQWVVPGLDIRQSLRSADQRVEFGQFGLSIVQHGLPYIGRFRPLFDQHQEPDRPVRVWRGPPGGLGLPLGKLPQQGLGVRLDQRRAVLLEQAQAVGDQVVLWLALVLPFGYQGPVRGLQ
nr:hypothetical protein [Verminephrobacter eiseniae]